MPGGGVALLRASMALLNLKLDADEQFGVNIVKRACEEPLRQIVLNCGTEGAVVVEHVRAQTDPNFGFNATTEKYEDLVKAGGFGSHEGHAHGYAECCLYRLSHAHDRSDDLYSVADTK